MAASCTVSIASQNVGMNPGQRISEAAKATFMAENADVLCMQEGRPLSKGEFIDNDAMVSMSQGNILLDDGPYLTRVRPHQSLTTMSLELPLYGAADLNGPGLPAKYGGRTFQQVTVRKARQTIVVCNVHCRCGTAMDTAPEFRRKALRNVKSHAEQALADGRADAVLVCGDVNLSDADTAAIFASTPWNVDHIRGGTRETGQPFFDMLTFLSATPAIRHESVASTLGRGDGHLSDVHGAGKVVLTIDLPAVKWSQYAIPDSTAFWWCFGTPGTAEEFEFFLEDSAAEQGWSLEWRNGEKVWRRGDEFFFAATGGPFLL